MLLNYPNFYFIIEQTFTFFLAIFVNGLVYFIQQIFNTQFTKSIITIHTFYLLFHFSLSDKDICFEFVNKIGTCCVQQVVKLRKRNVSWPAI